MCQKPPGSCLSTGIRWYIVWKKIKKLTGLDLREFDHAIVFKVALMVKKYLTANPIKY